METQGLALLRQLNLKALKPEIKEITGVVPKEVATYLLNKKREELIDIESKREVLITIQGNLDMVSGESSTIIKGS